MALSVELESLLKQAKSEARSRGNKTVEIAHFLITCLKESNQPNAISDLFSKKANVSFLNKKMDKHLNNEYPPLGGDFSPINSVDLERIIVEASKFSFSNDIELTHVIGSMLESNNEFIENLFKEYNITFDDLEDLEINEQDQHSQILKQESFIGKFCTDMSEECKSGKIQPIIGRNNEIRTIVEILNKKFKNNPFLKGEPGVGKTAIIEGLAYRLFSGDVPQDLKDTKIYRLNNNLLAATDEYKGVLAANVEGLMKELKGLNGKAILFIDEAHTVLNKNGNGPDIADMIRETIATGEVPMICATTNEDYLTYIEKDKSLVRRFQPLDILEPSIEDTISILRGIKKRLETHYKIQIMDEAIVESVKTSAKYISDRRLPDKAIDLLDQTCALVKINTTTTPTVLDEIVRKTQQIDLEISSLQEDGFNINENKIKSLENEKVKFKEKEEVMLKDFKIKDKIKNDIKVVVDEMIALEEKSNELMSQGDMEQASKIKYDDIPVLNLKLKGLKNNKFNIKEKDVVRSNDVFSIISRWTGIPLIKLEESETDKYLRIEEDLKIRVKGQDEALKVISDSIIRSTAGLASPNKPIGTFLFVGPTGVGKTETAKALAQLLFNDERKMIRLDMSEFQQEHMVQRLTGSPAGYVGYDAGGQLTESVKKNPYSVVLLDEIEKAHPKVWDTFLQIFDDGRLTDAKGETVDFSNTIIIMTSNIGGEHLLDGNNEKNKDKVKNQIEKNFKPEFINRIDNIVYFNTLSMESKKEIAYKFLDSYIKRLSEKGYVLEFGDNVLEKIISESYNDNYGARPIKKYIDDNIGTFLGRSMLTNPSHKKIKVEYDENLGYIISNKTNQSNIAKSR